MFDRFQAKIAIVKLAIKMALPLGNFVDNSCLVSVSDAACC
jgi:hypothetical protein